MQNTNRVAFNLQIFTDLVSKGHFVGVIYKKASGEVTKRTVKKWATKTSERYQMTGKRNYDRAKVDGLQVECLGRKGPRVFKSSGVLAYKLGGQWRITQNYKGENIDALLPEVDENVMKQTASKALTQKVLGK